MVGMVEAFISKLSHFVRCGAAYLLFMSQNTLRVRSFKSQYHEFLRKSLLACHGEDKKQPDANA
jgi:hypothetical protein